MKNEMDKFNDFLKFLIKEYDEDSDCLDLIAEIESYLQEKKL